MEDTRHDLGVVDLEELASSGRKAPKGRRFRIRVDDQRHIVDSPNMLGREILDLAGRIPVEDYVLVQIMRGRPNETINFDEQVDFTKPGVERFVTGLFDDEDLKVIVEERGPKYCLNIEGEIYPWDEDTITVPQIRELGNLPRDLPVIEIDLTDNSQRTLAEDEIVHLRPGLGFSKKIKYKRG